MAVPRGKKSRLILAVVALLGISLAGGLIATIVTDGFEATAEGITLEAAEQQMHHRMELPPSAKDVAYLSNVWSTWVDFAISEPDFMNWCHAHKWACFSINPGGFHTIYRVVDGRRTPAQFKSGQGFKARTGDFGFAGTFDRTRKRASVSFITR